MTDVRTPTTWPDNADPTAEQLADWLTACTREELVAFTARSLKVIAVAARCFEHGHDARIAHLQRVAAAEPEGPTPPACERHVEVQHRDRCPPWCNDCGWRHATTTRAQKIGLSMSERREFPGLEFD